VELPLLWGLPLADLPYRQTGQDCRAAGIEHNQLRFWRAVIGHALCHHCVIVRQRGRRPRWRTVGNTGWGPRHANEQVLFGSRALRQGRPVRVGGARQPAVATSHLNKPIRSEVAARIPWLIAQGKPAFTLCWTSGYDSRSGAVWSKTRTV